jgi:hypothetical protein
MTRTSSSIAGIQDQRGLWLRCFLKATLLLALVTGFCFPTAAHAANCPAQEELGLKKLQGIVYGPSGIALPQIVIRLSREGKFVAQTETDAKGKFEFKPEPGHNDLEFLFMGSKSMDLKARIGHGGGFRSGRLRIVLGLSGTRCGFVTLSSKELKKAIKRFQGQLLEKQY